MDSNKDRNFYLYIGIGAALGATYWIVNYLSNRKTSNAKPLSLERTRKILQQIKYQIITTCTTFVQGLKLKPQTNHSQQDLQIFYRSELAKIYQLRQDNTLAKFMVSKDEYAASLNEHKTDTKIQQGQKEIFETLQNAVKCIYPDYTVHRDARNLLTQQQAIQVYLEMCELISIRVWQKLEQQKQNNPGFNSKDDMHFKKAIRQLSIYDIKVQFLQKKGFRPEWGCPNETFYKVLEFIKQENKQVKHRAAAIDKAYEKVIEKITNQPQNLNPERIKFVFDEIVNNKVPEKPAPQIQPRAQVPLISSVQSAHRKVEPPKKNDDFDMDALMMQQLMSRSQEEPKQEVEAPKVEPIKVQVINNPIQIQAEIKQEQKQEPVPKQNIVPQVVPVNTDFVNVGKQVEKIQHQEVQGAVEVESQSTVIAQVQQIAEENRAEETIQQIKQEQVREQIPQVEEVKPQEVNVQQVQEVLPAEVGPRQE